MLRGFLKDVARESVVESIRAARTLVGGALIRVGARVMGYSLDSITPIDLTEDPDGEEEDEDPDLHVSMTAGRGFGHPVPPVALSPRAQQMRADGAAPTPTQEEPKPAPPPRWSIEGRVAAARASGGGDE